MANVAHSLHAKGWRTIIPYLRGSRPTRFLSQDTPRFAGGVALAQDAIDLADALNLNRFAVVGHDWGARAAYIMAALFPERLTALAALSLAFQPRGVFRVPDFEQSRRFWYQWFQCIDGGCEAVGRDPVGFARIQWDTWSPPGWFDETEFAATAETFLDPEWAVITLNAYRARWISGEVTDARYDALQRKLRRTERLSTPTLMIEGASDFCDSPTESEGFAKFFIGGYHRLLLENVGHFPIVKRPDWWPMRSSTCWSATLVISLRILALPMQSGALDLACWLRCGSNKFEAERQDEQISDGCRPTKSMIWVSDDLRRTTKL